ncbi:SPFH domain-containing protein [Lactovum miscens]|uniref:Regulator of protease activity HflC (Stomatin/prohibitin superfamily) n=1 Tax=Lactovum miscens TaxID=190387 RepID=A0A841C765_9LACT|nr:SPFH domain-containing protein [Lactovum miscens]MBB5887391.1 regulator of protease activity HflC (stomatin/prohibitin superfamily) [Lactovum miscens]
MVYALIVPLVILLVIVIVVIASISSLLFAVKQQTVAVVERFGKFKTLAQAGIHAKLPWGIDRIAARIQLRLIQSDILVEMKTSDNVFVNMNVSTQYRVNEQNIKDAYYKLTNPVEQIKSYIEDALRSAVPKLTLDALFAKNDEVALEVQKQVAEEMGSYGYIIVKTLITKIEPNSEVKQSMNEINAAQRKQDAAQMLANANKIQVVTAAEAEAEKDRLHGVGLAQQRKAIVDGLAQQINEMKQTGVELSEESIMSILLINQYLDTLNQFASKGNSTIFLPAGAEGIQDLRTQMLAALEASKK